MKLSSEKKSFVYITFLAISAELCASIVNIYIERKKIIQKLENAS